MDKERLINKITDILNELNQQVEAIKAEEQIGIIQAIEVDLFAANAAYLTEHAKVYAKLSGGKKENEKKGERISPVEQEILDEADSQETRMEESQEMEEPILVNTGLSPNPYVEPEADENTGDVVDAIDEDTGEQINAYTEPSFEEKSIKDKNSTLEFEDRLMQPIADKQPNDEAVRLNEKFQAKGDTLYDRIAAQRQTSAIKQVPIGNLSRGIGLNERFYFTKSLFNGNISDFEQSLSNLDNCGSLGEALEYVNNNLVKVYSWESKEEDSRKFYDLLKRRFM